MTKEEHDVHTHVCPEAPLDDGQPEGILYDDEGLCFLDSSSTLEGFQYAGENRDRGPPVASEDGDLGPPDITHDEDTVDGLCSECPDLTADSSTAESNLQCKTFLSDGVPHLYISDPNVIDSDDSTVVQSDSSQAKDTPSDDQHLSLARRKLQKKKSGTRKDSLLHVQYGNDIQKKVKPFSNKPTQSSFATSKHKPPKMKVTEVQCFLCRFNTDTLRSLKLHLKDKHGQQVSFSFRSLYHSSLHLKCRFFVCPMLDCTVYRYNEADVVIHYRQCHHSVPHQYLDPTYSPAPVKFQRRMNKRRSDKPEKPKTPDSLSQAGQMPAFPEKEGQYQCLYCDQYYYSNSISKMKAHYLSVHPSMPIVVRDVMAFKNKRMSRVSVCENIHCDFTSYVPRRLEEHAATVHGDQWEMVRGSQVMQCTSCGWVTTDDSLVLTHLTTVHAGETGATMVTLNSDDDPCL